MASDSPSSVASTVMVPNYYVVLTPKSSDRYSCVVLIDVAPDSPSCFYLGSPRYIVSTVMAPNCCAVNC